MFPEEGDAIDTVSAGKRLLQALDIIDIRLNDLRAEPGQFLAL
jgi:hypothetical protein